MSNDKKSKIATKAITAALAALMIVVAAPAAHADWHGRGGGGWDRHAGYARHDWQRWHGPRPGYVYAPPVDYYPPPVSPGLNIGLNFR